MQKKIFIRFLSALLMVITLFSVVPAMSVFAADVNSDSALSPAVEYSLPYETANGLYAYAGTEVLGANAWQRWNNGSDGRYFFLPSTASDSEVIVLNTYSEAVTLNGVVIPAGHYCTVPYKEGMSYTCSGAITRSVRIYKTDAEGTIFINSADGMTTKNDAGVKTTESATFDLYSFITSGTKNQEAGKLDGAVASEGYGVDEVETTIKKLKGRGNTTWDLAKKPFNITFDENVVIDGMKGKKWSLLANAQDPSLMRNRMIYDVSNEVGAMYACDSRFVDMFVNGAYKGSYQLTQKIELGKNTVMPDLTEPEVEDIVEDDGTITPYPKENFDFVIELDMAKKAASSGDLTFTSTRGQVMTHKIPDAPAAEQIAFIKAKYQALEDALYTDNMSKLETIIDINDLARAYLINEITKNLDAALTSCYFVYNSSNDMFYASPVWDFDNGVGNTVGISDRKDSSGKVLDITKPDGWYARELMHIDSSFKGGRTIFSQACYMTSKTSEGKTFMDIAENIWSEDFADIAAILTGDKDAQNGRLRSAESYFASLAKSGEWNYSNGGWEFSNNTINSWIANHSSLLIYTYNAENNTVSSKKNYYDQTTFKGQVDYAADWLVSRVNWLSAQFANATVEVPEVTYTTIYFTKPNDWPDAYIYGFYGVEGGDTEAVWPADYPGGRMNYAGLDEYGQSVYSIKVPSDIDYVKFSDGSSYNRRTNNVPNSKIVENSAFYVTTLVGTNKWDVASYIYNPELPEDTKNTEYTDNTENTEASTTTSEATWDEVAPTTSTYTIRGDFTSWGSMEPLKYAQGSTTTLEAVYTVPAGIYYFKVHDLSTSAYYGNDGAIDSECTNWGFRVYNKYTGEVTSNCGWVAQSGTYKFLIDVADTSRIGVSVIYLGATVPELTEPTEPSVTIPATTTPDSEYITIYFSNAWMWTDVAVCFHGSALEPDTQLPGKPMTYVETNEYGQDIYKAVIPADVEGVVFTGNDFGDYTQSPGVIPRDGYGYYMDWNETDGTFVGEYKYETSAPETDPDETSSAAPETTSTDLTVPETVPNVTEPTVTETIPDVTEPTEPDTKPEEIAETFYVAFVDYDNSLLGVQLVKSGESVVAPEVPTRKGYNFVGWDTEFSNVTSNLTVKAVYEKIPTTPTPAPTTGNLNVQVVGGTGFTIAIDGSGARPQGPSYMNSKMPIGASVTVKANSASGAQFIGWQNSVTGAVLSTEQEYTFLASGNDSIKAMYAVKIEGVQMVTFKNSKAGNFGRVLDSQYYASADAISFPDAPTQVGYDFSGWSMTEAEIQAAIAKGEDVTVLAEWTKALVPVEVTVIGGTGSGTYYANNQVTVTANEAEAGKKFAYWTDASGNIRSYNAEYTFFPSADTTVTAVFVDEDEVIDYQILVSLDSIDTTSVADKSVFTYSWYCPEEYTFVKAGIVAVNKDNYNESTFVAGSSDSNVYDRSPSGANLKPVNTFTWTKSNVASGQTWMAKAYVQYRDASGQIITVYSDAVEATKD